MLRFDERGLLANLLKVPWPRRVIFAASCATRLFPAYVRFHRSTKFGDPLALSYALDSAWEAARVQKSDRFEFNNVLSKVMELIPKEDNQVGEFYAYAEDAATAVAYTLRALLTEDAQEAAWAARTVYE